MLLFSQGRGVNLYSQMGFDQKVICRKSLYLCNVIKKVNYLLSGSLIGVESHVFSESISFQVSP